MSNRRRCSDRKLYLEIPDTIFIPLVFLPMLYKFKVERGHLWSIALAGDGGQVGDARFVLFVGVDKSMRRTEESVVSVRQTWIGKARAGRVRALLVYRWAARM